jgi:hypothetical protein
MRSFVRDYTAGLREEDVRGLFQRDAAEAWAVLTRDQEAAPGARHGLSRLLFAARVFFLGLSYKLSPARRLLFVAALACALFGVVAGFNVSVAEGSFSLRFEAAPLWYLLAVGCLVFLLALELVDRVRVRDELEVARQLQVDLLPREAPRVPGYGFAHAYRTANEVGGDYYDFQPLDDGRLALVIGDASGHGMAAGLLMAIANATLHTALDLDPTPERVAGVLNRALYRAGDRRAFMSVFYGLLEPASGRLRYVCAGHPFPLLRRAGGAVEELGCGGLPLGIRRELAVTVESTVVEPGDLLLFYTDGLPEAVDAESRALGFDAVTRQVAAGGTPEAVRDRLLALFDGHRGAAAPRDDLSLVVLARHAAPPPPPPPAVPAPDAA